MKTLTATMAVLIALASPAMAESITEKVTGCATIDRGGYHNVAEPGCINAWAIRTGNEGGGEAPVEKDEAENETGGENEAPAS